MKSVTMAETGLACMATVGCGVPLIVSTGWNSRRRIEVFGVLALWIGHLSRWTD